MPEISGYPTPLTDIAGYDVQAVDRLGATAGSLRDRAGWL
jgi:hypothetical protein